MPSHCEHRWTKRGNKQLSTQAVQYFLPKTPGWLIRMSTNFHKMYRNDCQLTCWNQNCDIPIRFRTPVCQINENRQISAESQHNFHFLPHFNSRTRQRDLYFVLNGHSHGEVGRFTAHSLNSGYPQTASRSVEAFLHGYSVTTTLSHRETDIQTDRTHNVQTFVAIARIYAPSACDAE